jgi:hypothetical protein
MNQAERIRAAELDAAHENGLYQSLRARARAAAKAVAEGKAAPHVLDLARRDLEVGRERYESAARRLAALRSGEPTPELVQWGRSGR